MKFRLVAVVMLGILLTGCIGGFGQRADVGVYMINSGGLEDGVSVSSLATLGLEAPDTEKEIKAIWVTVTEVKVQRDGNWETIAVEHQGKINLMDLQFPMLLGQASVPAGTYQEIRFRFAEEGLIEFEDGEVKTLYFPSSESKIDLSKKRIVAGSVTQLIFDVNPESFAKRGSGDVYNANPSKSLRFVKEVKAEFGELDVRIQLPEDIDKFVSAKVSLYKSGEPEPIWNTELQDGVFELKISYLTPGDYDLKASVTLFDKATLNLSAGPIEVKAGEVVESILMEMGK